eukprot:CAMPEP_0205923758 /NCGR_PEP_ID=MMETSP1325-20131115/16589_1 /ASSEMBLY_ACC=CAM_ASM_000708 /TAXON_ID=236786 /ORGANISM="Florenciella sp., Strain RCC1007" /LENGTH=79 /DNA_ID=CAMNT_0053292023 /DNA_START=12 /DNA_END=248 /DNA_ORIENTATION=-
MSSSIDFATLRRARSFGATSPAQITAFLTGEDLYALGFVFMELWFSAIVLDDNDNNNDNDNGNQESASVLSVDQSTLQR